MNNPWVDLPLQTPFILDCDKAAIEEFNRQHPSKIRVDLLPEPYLGNPQKAKVILLNLNPGFDKSDYEFYRHYFQVCRDNLIHKPSEYPFYLLNPAYREFTAHQWWYKKLRWLIHDVGLEKVSNAICCIEFFPYHSGTFGAEGLNVASQQYSFHRVSEACEMGKIIVIMRSKKRWLQAVPGLKDYPYYTLNSPQAVYISPNNFAGNGYQKLKDVLVN